MPTTFRSEAEKRAVLEAKADRFFKAWGFRFFALMLLCVMGAGSSAVLAIWCEGWFWFKVFLTCCALGTLSLFFGAFCDITAKVPKAGP